MGGEVPVPKKLTPLESAIADQTDRRRSYEKRRREAGHRKMTVWCPGDYCDHIKLICKALSEIDDPVMREAIAAPLREAYASADMMLEGQRRG